MPCFGPPWYEGLQPDSEPYRAAREKMEAHLRSMKHVIHAYLEMQNVQPPDGSYSEFGDTAPTREFQPELADAEFVHRVAQHCICDKVPFTLLYELPSVLTPQEYPLYAPIIMRVAVAMRSRSARRPFDAQSYARIWSLVPESKFQRHPGP